MPKQGDHVFNDLETAIVAPVETITSFQGDTVNGQHFLDDYLLHTKCMFQKLAGDELWRSSRSYTASDGDEEDVLKELRKLQPKMPSLPRLEPVLLREIHDDNANRFGERRERYEYDFFNCLQDLLTGVANGDAAGPAPRSMLGAHIAFQRMVDRAYDPAAALVVVTKRSLMDDSIGQGVTQRLISSLAQAAMANDPTQWTHPFELFPLSKAGETKRVADGMHATLEHRRQINVQGQTVLRVMCAELATKENPRITPGERREASGYMLHLVNQRLRQMQSKER